MPNICLQSVALPLYHSLSLKHKASNPNDSAVQISSWNGLHLTPFKSSHIVRDGSEPSPHRHRIHDVCCHDTVPYPCAAAWWACRRTGTRGAGTTTRCAWAWARRAPSPGSSTTTTSTSSPSPRTKQVIERLRSVIICGWRGKGAWCSFLLPPYLTSTSGLVRDCLPPWLGETGRWAVSGRVSSFLNLHSSFSIIWNTKDPIFSPALKYFCFLSWWMSYSVNSRYIVIRFGITSIALGNHFVFLTGWCYLMNTTRINMNGIWFFMVPLMYF